MNSHDNFLKTAFGEWVRLSAVIPEIVSELEKEIERMRERKVPDELVERKDEMIEKIVKFFNSTDQLINAYRIGIANKEAEIMIANDLVHHAMRTDLRERIFKRLAEGDVNELKERQRLKRELIEKINGKDHTEKKV